MYGLIVSCFVWTSRADPPPLQAFHPTISARQVNFGETLFIAGMCRPFPVTDGGLIASGHRSNCLILSDWITSAVSTPTGRSQPAPRRQLEGRPPEPRKPFPTSTFSPGHP